MSLTATSADAIKASLTKIFARTIDTVAYVPEDLPVFAYGRAAPEKPPVESPPPNPDPSSSGDTGVAASPAAELAKTINALYDPRFLDHNNFISKLMDEQGFRNIGYWPPGTVDQHQASEQLQDYLLSHIPEKTGRILDVACGLGASTRRLLAHYPAENVWAINISEKQIESTRTLAPGCHALVMNAVEMTFEDAFFDNIICIEAAFHFETRRKFLEDALRILKPGGHLVMSDVLFTSPARHTQFAQMLPSPANHLESAESYQALLEEIGFRNAVVKNLRDMIWRPHFLKFVTRLHERFLDREIGFLELVDNLLFYYEMDRVTGPCLVVSAEK